MIRLVQMADLHLGRQLFSTGYPASYAKERREAAWHALKAAFAFAEEQKAGYFLLCGDVYESDYFSLEDMLRLRNVFAGYPDIQILICCGNHDPYDGDSLYRLVEMPEHVRLFTRPDLHFFEFPEDHLRIYGNSWTSSSPVDRSEVRASLDDQYTNILMLHGSVPREPGFANSYDQLELRELKYDYIALGHIHEPKLLSERIAYSGIPEPMDFGEETGGGLNLIQLDGSILHRRWKSISSREFRRREIQLDYDDSEGEAITKLLALAEPQHFYRISLLGEVSPSLKEKIPLWEKALKDSFYYLEILDRTTGVDQLEELTKMDAELMELLEQNLAQLTQEEELREMALQLACRALWEQVNGDEN